MSLPLILEYSDIGFITGTLKNQWVLLAITLLSAYIMNAEIPLFSLKIKKFNFKDNAMQIIFLLISLLLLFVFQFLGVALVIVFYVLLSVVMNALTKTSSNS
jgi:CDP-diacylglycerol--serine O-phosphatidyltransferase